MRSLDLVVSIDSMPAHLAGALGVPVRVLLARDADWRWMDEREDSPWYPTMRLLRQSRAADWATPIARLQAELRTLARRHSGLR
jgi:ADP-heptose:LPS heptosyltransferase